MAGRHHAERGGSRHAVRGLVILLLFFGLLGGGAVGFYAWATGASGAPSKPVAITIPEGSTTSEISEILVSKGVVRSALAFRLVARFRGSGSSIQAGEYELRTNMRPQQALDALGEGPIVETVSFTIPEGLRVDQVGEVVAEVLPIDPKAFEGEAQGGSYSLPPYLPEGRKTVEGFLFPKTYEVHRESDATAVIQRLLQQFEEEVAGLPWQRAEKLGLTPYEIVIVASLIEREAGVEEDRAKIASVIYNRMREGMRLQIDATVQYALPKHKPRLTYEDYKVKSPYNTYLNDGLPPTPIASPGLASLEAALRPAKTNFLFYLVVDDTGRHGFTETYEEFLRLKNEVQG